MRAPADIIPPPRLAKRPVDRRGYPIPFVTYTDENGKPDFHVIDMTRVVKVVDKHLCGLCGEDLEYWMAFVGGPLAARNLSYSDPAMHVDCAEYAVRVCPFLAMTATTYARHTKVETFDAPGFVRTKPQVTVMVITRNYKVHVGKDIRQYAIKPSNPREIRVYPYEGDGYYYNPDKAMMDALVAEAQKLVDDERRRRTGVRTDTAS